MKSLKCASYLDELTIVNVEANFIRGLPGFSIAGLAGATIKESENRVKSALLNLNFSFPAQKIIINLSPSDLPKNGSIFDLSIALLIALQNEPLDENLFVFGELGLDGRVKSTNSLFSILLFLSQKVIRAKVLLPSEIAIKAAAIPNLEIFGVSNLSEAIEFIKDPQFAQSCKVTKNHEIFENFIKIGDQIYIPNRDFTLDFADVRGQTRAKRACLIAACGMHNILFEGSPGSGKSMCAKRIRHILPPQSINEILLCAAYESLNNKNAPFSALRPFRSPHHTSTRGSIFGGGSALSPRIGEVALANGGELFFDELPHFGKQILESLREPLEDNQILISRVNSKVKYETKFIFVGAMNPCPCGNLFKKDMSCLCSQNEIKRYKSAISAPILDRIDIYVAMDETRSNDKADVTSEEMSREVLRVFRTRILRGQSEPNGKMSDEQIARFCTLSNQAKELLNAGIERFNLSARSINKTLKLARTIADLNEHEILEKQDISEALGFRVRF